VAVLDPPKNIYSASKLKLTSKREFEVSLRYFIICKCDTPFPLLSGGRKRGSGHRCLGKGKNNSQRRTLFLRCKFDGIIRPTKSNKQHPQHYFRYTENFTQAHYLTIFLEDHFFRVYVSSSTPSSSTHQFIYPTSSSTHQFIYPVHKITSSSTLLVHLPYQFI